MAVAEHPIENEQTATNSAACGAEGQGGDPGEPSGGGAGASAHEREGRDPGEGGDEDPDCEPDENDPMNPAAWSGEPDVCGSCIAWRPEDPRPGEDVASGACKLRPELGRVPATLKKCSIYKPRGQFVYSPSRSSGSARRPRTQAARVLRRSADGELVSAASRPAPVRRVFEEVIEEETDEGTLEPRPPRPAYDVPKEIDLGPDAALPQIRQALVDLIRREHGKSRIEIHSKYRTGGRAIARTRTGESVEISAERFFAILERVRSSLDALESAVEGAKRLGEDREELVVAIRRMHGSFTTFNLMIADRGDYFSGKD